ncbi:lytic murein transglycosylase [Arcobacter sp.]|uniref:lytic murein transglycosylase n=1 Tax=Arcobacter sp. TaxID=1872629 RepID=UPI003C711BD9
MKFLFIFMFLFLSLSFAEDFNKIKNVEEFKSYMVKEHKFNEKELSKLFSDVKIQKDSLWFYTKPHKTDYKTHYWTDYSKNFLSKKKVQAGVDFLKKNNEALYKAYKEYKIPSAYIVAIIGIESNYGGFMGKNPTFDTLSTLAFKKNRRNSFFKKELEAYLLMTRKERVDPKEIKGSFAGAIGYCQFMPSNFKKVAVDLDENNQIRLDKPNDAIGSIANYLRISGWERGTPVAVEVNFDGKRFDKFKTGYTTSYDRNDLVGIKPIERFYYDKHVSLIKLKKKDSDELWYATKNFKVITTYNRSAYYAMAVHQLASKIKTEYLKQKNN